MESIAAVESKRSSPPDTAITMISVFLPLKNQNEQIENNNGTQKDPTPNRPTRTPDRWAPTRPNKFSTPFEEKAWWFSEGSWGEWEIRLAVVKTTKKESKIASNSFFILLFLNSFLNFDDNGENDRPSSDGEKEILF